MNPQVVTPSPEMPAPTTPEAPVVEAPVQDAATQASEAAFQAVMPENQPAAQAPLTINAEQAAAVVTPAVATVEAPLAEVVPLPGAATETVVQPATAVPQEGAAFAPLAEVPAPVEAPASQNPTSPSDVAL